MIQKLRFRFILLATVSLFILLSVIVTSMNILNYIFIVNDAEQFLSVLSQNDGVFSEDNVHFGNHMQDTFSPEAPYEYQYFTVIISELGEAAAVDTTKISSIDKDTAIKYAAEIFGTEHTKGFLNSYRYIVYESAGVTKISFLDCGRSLGFFENFLLISITVSLFGFGAVFLVVFVLSKKIVYPIAEAYRKQRRFITDAGHEIKTPLTIINANLDILEMDLGSDNENIAEIGQQTKRLRSLTDELILLARMEEVGNSLEKIDFPLSEVVRESAHPFYTLASSQGKEFVCNIAPMLTLRGNDNSIRRLVFLLLDNAIKYSPASGKIVLTLKQKGKKISMSVFNTTAEPIRQNQLAHVFDRFYRTDTSRNSETGGHGIGLSVAQAIVAAHEGDICATTGDGMSFQVSVWFPVC